MNCPPSQDVHVSGGAETSGHMRCSAPAERIERRLRCTRGRSSANIGSNAERREWRAEPMDRDGRRFGRLHGGQRVSATAMPNRPAADRRSARRATRRQPMGKCWRRAALHHVQGRRRGYPPVLSSRPTSGPARHPRHPAGIGLCRARECAFRRWQRRAMAGRSVWGGLARPRWS